MTGGWRATFYTTGMEHSPTSATGTGWERTPWQATQRAAWETLRQARRAPMAPLKDRSVDPRKAALVVDFLKEAFPGHDVHDTEDFSRGCQFYRIDERGTGGVLHRVRVSRVFLDDHTERQVIRKLEDWQVPTIIRQAGLRSVLVTNEGCAIQTEQDD
jgi:hypothetical protein